MSVLGPAARTALDELVRTLDDRRGGLYTESLAKVIKSNLFAEYFLPKFEEQRRSLRAKAVQKAGNEISGSIRAMARGGWKVNA